MEKGQILTLEIEDMSSEGKGIGKADGYTVFVDDAVIGDRVNAELTKVKKNYGFGRVTDIIAPSPDRTEPFCRYNGICGGCQYGMLDYAAQLKLKEKQVRDKLIRLGGVRNPKVAPVIGMEEPFRYRNKAGMPVSTGGLITKKGGIVEPVHEPRIGFYRQKSHDVVDCQDCWLQSEPAMAAAAALRRFMEEEKITSYDPRWEKGLMRHMIVRTAKGTGQVMIILVINGSSIPNAEKLVGMLDDAIFDVPVYDEGPLAGVEFNLESVILNVNRKKSQEIMGDECMTLAGSPTILDEAGGLKFEISPLSFYQVNSGQMVQLYGKALEYADIRGGETVLDLYCGVGTIGLFAAAAGAGQVIGIESERAAVLDANRNAVINGIVNARYVCGLAEDELPKIIGSREKNKDDGDGDTEDLHVEKADVVFLDPPRSGCDEKLLNAVLEIKPQKIIYVSCDPATLARDIRKLTENGYTFEEASPVDMFPWTSSIETVALLSR